MSNLRFAKNLKEDATVPASGDTVVLAEAVFDRNYHRLAFELENTGGNALDKFTLQGKLHADGQWFTLVASWGTASEVLRYTVGTLESLASAGFGHAVVDVDGIYSIRAIASAAAGGASTSILGALT